MVFQKKKGKVCTLLDISRATFILWKIVLGHLRIACFLQHMAHVDLSVERDGLGAFNQIYSVRLPEQFNELIVRGIFCVPIK